jgi:hypothetical protein
MEKGRIEFENESSRFIKSDKRAKAIANMGLVERDGDTFKVSTLSLRGNQTSYKVWRDNGTPNGQPSRVKCNCLEYQEEVKNNTSFRCSHILAVKYSLIRKIPVTSESIAQAEKEIKTAEIASNEHLTPLPQGIRTNVLNEVIRKIENMKIEVEKDRDDNLVNFTYESIIIELKKMLE